MAEIIILLLLRLSFYFGLYFQRPIIFLVFLFFAFLLWAAINIGLKNRRPIILPE